MGEVCAVFVHGVGHAKAGFSSYAQRRLRAALKPRGLELHSQEVLWGAEIDHAEAAMMVQVGKLGSANAIVQRESIGAGADALSYPAFRDNIMGLMDEAYARTRADTVTIFAHSLGCLVACDWLRSRSLVRARLVSMGCNLQLFALAPDSIGQTWACPMQLKAPGAWTNLWSRPDALGWPVHGWQPQVRDVEVPRAIWSWSRIVPALAHTDYWKTERIWSSTVPGLF